MCDLSNFFLYITVNKISLNACKKYRQKKKLKMLVNKSPAKCCYMYACDIITG